MKSSTVTKNENATPANDETPPTKVIEAPTKLVRDIGVWKRLYIVKEQAEAAELAQRAKVFTEMRALGVTPGGQVLSKHGAVPMLGGGAPKPPVQVIDWEGVARAQRILAERAGVEADALDAIVAANTKTVPGGAPTKEHIKAVTGWAAEAKVA